MTAAAADRPIAREGFLRLWLWSLAALVFAMVLVGGATRLTDSGLSITEWQPILGALPPLSEAQWLEAFEKYKAIPEYRLVNRGMSIAEFKAIYWWEWAHRFLGRFIGLVLIVPMAVLWLTRRLDARMIRPLLLLLSLGALQGALGWYMVKSGLAERTDVSQYRLAAHLLLAAVIYASIIWIAAGLTFSRPRGASRNAAAASALLLLLFMQIGLGGLVAGLDAGLSHNSFPLMDGRLIPDGLMIVAPWWRNLFENALTVQFLHRLLAYAIALAAVLNVLDLWRSGGGRGPKLSALAVLSLVVVQVALGIWTLLAGVPLPLGLLHQAGAMLLLSAAVIHQHLVARGI
ncbi:MAG TPA: COX15/CtaA family protein [Aestuariivirgaceae bacterium]